MKLIDNKGRIFGKINIFDILIIIVLIFGLSWGYQRYTNNQPVAISEQSEVLVQIFIHDVRNVTTNAIQEGDRLHFSENHQFFGEIVDKQVTAAEKLVETEDGKIVKSQIPGKYDMLITVKGFGTITNRSIIIGSREIRVGMPLKVYTNLYEVNTTVFVVEDQAQ
ncbi:DUF4330 domain-containing protein [Alkaliphilus peptidifermentans]|uniref:DUF4330 domain-containing protein n=1 Tax=Alkaliphilus peptidifermentans DSM 18978 TaxID=1120976 RepID=A0A1G5GBT2_9FIRM|nr:DUF4330 domain-containing protein [Alkaliphilus peptidifermentans]SCY48954.1 protein of unknown function [Alkaliphilus peptidifermentans DSM 18978]